MAELIIRVDEEVAEQATRLAKERHQPFRHAQPVRPRRCRAPAEPPRAPHLQGHRPRTVAQGRDTQRGTARAGALRDYQVTRRSGLEGKPMVGRDALFAVAVAVLCLWRSPVGAGEVIRPGDKVCITSGPASVKIGEKTVCTVQAGTILEVEKVKGSWYKVTADGRTGWVHERRIALVEKEAEPAPGTELTADQAAADNAKPWWARLLLPLGCFLALVGSISRGHWSGCTLARKLIGEAIPSSVVGSVRLPAAHVLWKRVGQLSLLPGIVLLFAFKWYVGLLAIPPLLTVQVVWCWFWARRRTLRTSFRRIANAYAGRVDELERLMEPALEAALSKYRPGPWDPFAGLMNAAVQADSRAFAKIARGYAVRVEDFHRLIKAVAEAVVEEHRQKGEDVPRQPE